MQIYLSPHLDDAALSAGGAIASHRATAPSGEKVLVINICAGAPDPAARLSPLAEELHRRWGVDSGAVNRVRRGEDAAAMLGLGARVMNLDFLEAIYRLPNVYRDYAALFGEIAADDPLPAQIDARLAPILAECPEATIHAPLGVGGHVDHRVVHLFGRVLASRGRAVVYYEELPYALRGGDLLRALAAIDLSLAPEAVPITAMIGPKLRAISCYASQVPVLFGSAAAMPDQVLEYSRGVAETLGLSNALAERRWRAAG